jgi:hypothetical protein
MIKIFQISVPSSDKKEVMLLHVLSQFVYDTEKRTFLFNGCVFPSSLDISTLYHFFRAMPLYLIVMKTTSILEFV